eukprot:8170581-Alexandrium_andersonii.AAC.1
MCTKLLPPDAGTFAKAEALFPPAAPQARAFAPAAPARRGRLAPAQAKHVRDHVTSARGFAHCGPA